MIDWKEIQDGENWEAFTRDFLVSLGLTIVHEPGRGADGGKDMIVSERMSGKLSSSDFKWLVSCKYFSISGKSVGVDDEQNISDRLRQHGSDGFMGFYSTIASSALIERLKAIRNDSGEDYYVWDGRSIEGSLLNLNQSNVFMRYLPKSFSSLRPISSLLGEQETMDCAVCGKDALQASLDGSFSANIVFATDVNHIVQKILVACKGNCDHKLENSLYKKEGLITGWEDVTDLCNPILFLRRMFALMNNQRADPKSYSDDAYESIKRIMAAVAQRTLRVPLSSDVQRYHDAVSVEGF